MTYALTCALRTAFTLALLLSPLAASADGVDDYLAAQMKGRHIPGLSLAVVRDGKVIKAKGYGVSNVELNTPATPETVYEIGSITKQFTATAIMLLVEEGKVGLDDKIAKYLDGLPDSWNAVTVRHLLTHTSGIRSYFGLPGFEFRNHLTTAQFIKTASVLKPNFPPGDDYLYSNTGYSLLGFIVEKASGQPYWSFLRERIFMPHAMNATTDRDPRKLVLNRADGYEWEKDNWINRDGDLTDVFSAGAVVSNVLDLAKWDAALYTERTLKLSSLDQMWTPVRFNSGRTFTYGLGWNVSNTRGHRLISHGGQTAGFSAVFSRFTDDRLTIIMLCNADSFGPGGAARLVRGVAAQYLPSFALDTLKAIPDAEPKLTGMIMVALRNSLSGTSDPNMFTPEGYKFITSERGKDLLKSVSRHGALKTLTLLDRRQDGRDRARLYRATVSGQTLYLSFTLTEDGKIAGVNIEED